MIYLKRIFPNNLYAAKGIKVKVDNSQKELTLNATGILSIQKANKLNLKLDYHKATIDILGSKIDAYYIVNLKPAKNSIAFFLRVLFKNSLEIRKVTEEEFNNFLPNMIYANQIPFELNKKNAGLLVLALAFSLFFTLYPLNVEGVMSQTLTMSFWFGVLSFMGFMSLFFLRNISEKQFYFRLSIFGLASAILAWMIFFH